MRRWLCVCLTLLLTVALALPAGASSRYSTRINATCNLPEVRVTVPATSSVLINPYQARVEFDGKATTDQIISSPAAIENESEMPLLVDVTVRGILPEESNIRLMSESSKGQDLTSKGAFVYFELVASNSEQGTWAEGYNEEEHILVRLGERGKRDYITLDAADGPNHFGAFRLTGDCVAFPRNPWTEDDHLNVEIVFTFKPIARSGTGP